MKIREALQSKFVFCERRRLKLIRITGSDRKDFMQRLSSQNMKEMRPGVVRPCAFLNANGTVVSLFSVWEKEAEVWLLVDQSWLMPTMQFLKKMHFSEDLHFDISRMEIFEARGSGLPKAWQSSLEAKEDINGVLPAWPAGVPGVLLTHSSYSFMEGHEVTEDQMSSLMLRLGVPNRAEHLDETNIILEGPFDDFVHRNKGCYPGQEVVERIYTYGKVAKQLVTVEFSGNTNDTIVGAELKLDGATVGKIQAFGESLDGSSTFAIASIKRLQLNPSKTYVVDGWPGCFATIIKSY